MHLIYLMVWKHVRYTFRVKWQIGVIMLRYLLQLQIIFYPHNRKKMKKVLIKRVLGLLPSGSNLTDEQKNRISSKLIFIFNK